MMRYAMWVLLVAACGGPSSTDIKAAKTAEYDAPLGQLFDAALDETQAEYTIGDVDPAKFRFTTKPLYFNAEGGRLTEGVEGVVQNVGNHSKIVHFVIEVKEAGPAHAVVVVTPRTFEVISGSPKPRELAPDDPNLPPWVKGRVDNLAVKIYHRCSALVAKGGAAAPAAQAPAAQAPAPQAPAPEAPAPQAP